MGLKHMYVNPGVPTARLNDLSVLVVPQIDNIIMRNRNHTRLLNSRVYERSI